MYSKSDVFAVGLSFLQLMTRITEVRSFWTTATITPSSSISATVTVPTSEHKATFMSSGNVLIDLLPVVYSLPLRRLVAMLLVPKPIDRPSASQALLMANVLLYCDELLVDTSLSLREDDYYNEWLIQERTKVAIDISNAVTLSKRNHLKAVFFSSTTGASIRTTLHKLISI
jgi:hypothetical protein